MSTTTLRASVTADAVNTNPGDPAPIVVDGADTAITANGLAGYTPMPGDRLLVQKVGGTLEIMQFLSTGSVPFVSTYRQDTAPDPATTPAGAVWYDTSNGNLPNRLENGAWVPMTLTSAAMDVEDVKHNVVESGFVLGGNNTAALSNGASAPTTAPTVDHYWPTMHSAPYGTGQDTSAFFAGLETYHADSTKWVTASIFFGTNIRVLNKSDLQIGAFPDPSNGSSWGSQFYSWGGIARVGTDYFLLGSDNDRSVDIYIYKIDGTTWAKTDELRLGDSNTFHGFHPRLVSDGTHLGMIWIPNSNDMMLRWYNTSLNQVGSDIHLLNNVTGGMQNIGDAFFDASGAGTGFSNMLWVALEGQGTAYPNVMAWLVTGTTSVLRSSGVDFAKASGNKIHAMSYDTTSAHVVSIDMDGVAYTYSQLACVGSQSFTARYTYYDGDTGNYAGAIGSGTVVINGTDVSGTASTAHETGYSPTATVSTFPRRSWARITVAPAPDVNNLDSTLVDRANRQGVYCALGGGTMWREVYTTVGQTVVDTFDAMPSTGTPDAHDFTTAQVSLGKFESVATRLDGAPKVYIDGSGESNNDGLVPPGSMMMFAGAAAPRGWLLCKGQSLSTTTYPDLFAAIGYTFGGSGASFNAPDMQRRTPFGVEASLALGHNDGVAAASRSPSHTHGGGTNSNANDGSHQHNIAGQAAGGTVSSGTAGGTAPSEVAYAGHAHGGATNNGANDGAHHHNITSDLAFSGGTIVMPHLVLNFIIKV